MSQSPQPSTSTNRARDARRGGGSMSEPKRRISKDWWTVLAALAAALLVKVGLLPAIPW